MPAVVKSLQRRPPLTVERAAKVATCASLPYQPCVAAAAGGAACAVPTKGLRASGCQAAPRTSLSTYAVRVCSCVQLWISWMSPGWGRRAGGRCSKQAHARPARLSGCRTHNLLCPVRSVDHVVRIVLHPLPPGRSDVTARSPSSTDPQPPFTCRSCSRCNAGSLASWFTACSACMPPAPQGRRGSRAGTWRQRGPAR